MDKRLKKVSKKVDTHGFFAYLYIIKLRDMKSVFVLLAAGAGAVLLAFGNDFGIIGLVPAIVCSIKDLKKA